VAVLHHQDPPLVLPRYQWNFLPAMPYVHALELSTGLPAPRVATDRLLVYGSLLVIAAALLALPWERLRQPELRGQRELERPTPPTDRAAA